MKNTAEFVLAVRQIAGSDNKAGPLVGVSQMTFTRWRTGIDFPSDEHAVRIAELLKLDDAYVLATIRRDRAPTDRTRRAWQRVAAAFGKAAALAAMSATPFLLPPPAQGGFNNNFTPMPNLTELHIACRRRRWWLGERA